MLVLNKNAFELHNYLVLRLGESIRLMVSNKVSMVSVLGLNKIQWAQLPKHITKITGGTILTYPWYYLFEKLYILRQF